jgi:hypothetical protein
MTVAQSNRHSKTSGEVVNEKKKGVILTAPTGCWVEIRMKYQKEKSGVRREESEGRRWHVGIWCCSPVF